ncbi:MAG: adenylate/guanylate cyclase domain-containing protein [Sinimarinibacterium sp.]|jgi:class 3 adenylate cyclase
MYDPITSPAASANAMLHLTILGVGLALASYDKHTATTRALAASFALWGSEELPRLWLRTLGLWPPGYEIMQIGWIGGYLSSIAGAEYLILVLRTAPSGDRPVRAAVAMLRVNQLLIASYFLLELLMPERYEQSLSGAGAGFLLFKSLELLGNATLVLPVAIVLIRGVDLLERRRVIALLTSTPFFLTTGFLPNGIIQILMAFVGLLIILRGCMGFLVAQGRRGEFMARFLSPQIRDRVREQGLVQALQQNRAEITIVCSDLRGFTAYAQARDSATVIEILRRYYDIAGDIAAQFGATIKDFAGDGVLILVGAPQPRADHARAGVDLAQQLVTSTRALLAEYSDAIAPLDVGAGVATGTVTAGVIDSRSRLEYAAVGAAVNLAARLCSAAAAGQVRLSLRTAELSGRTDLTELPRIALKGIGDAVQNFAPGPQEVAA